MPSERIMKRGIGPVDIFDTEIEPAVPPRTFDGTDFKGYDLSSSMTPQNLLMSVRLKSGPKTEIIK